MMAPHDKAIWVKALRSGEYKQCGGFLEADGCNCCLGVLARIKNVPVTNETDDYKCFVFVNDRSSGRTGTIPDDYCGISYSTAQVLAAMNDGGGKTFLEIADYIESNL